MEKDRTVEPKKRRGFAAMSPEKQKEIASMGGLAAHAKGTAHEFTQKTGRAAGRKGGKANAARLECEAREKASRRGTAHRTSANVSEPAE